jgi:hypothetical protein
MGRPFLPIPIVKSKGAMEMTTLDTIDVTAPSHWASYLINGDASGMEDDEIAACNAWIAREGVGMPVSCEDAGFIWYHDARPECPFGADCQTYTFLFERRG